MLTWRNVFSISFASSASAGVATWLWLSGKDPNRYADVVAGVSPNPQGGMTLALAGRF